MQRAELAPGDGPGRLDGLVREVDVTGDRIADPGHVVVVGRDDAREGGLVTVRGDQVTLTSLGFRRAAEATRTHRMWEIYMMEFAGSAPDHVDRSADAVEHLLPESLLLELEARLAREGRLPSIATEVPASPHELTGEGNG